MKQTIKIWKGLPLLLLLWLCGCTFSQEKPPDVAEAAFPKPQYAWGTVSDRTLTIWGRETDLNRVYMARAFRRYEELTGNTVQCVMFSPEDLEPALREAFDGAGVPPDLVLSFGGANIDGLNPDENFYDLSEEAWVEDLTDTSISQTIYHGKVIGLPHWEASISGTIYNREIFSRLGLTPPKTQAEFWAACETLLQAGITPLYLPCGTPSMLLYQFPLDTLVEDPETLAQLNAGALGYADLPDMHTVVEWYRVMAQRGYLGADYLQNEWDGMSEALESGKYAMMLCWDTWLYTDFQGDPSAFGLMPAFLGLPEEGTFEGPNLALLMVCRNGLQVDAALDLLTFMADPYNYNAAFADIYTAPVFKRQVDSISTPQYVEAARWIEQNYRDSTAWLRICGFSQSDASCILRCMTEEGYSVMECLQDMDALRLQRISEVHQ